MNPSHMVNDNETLIRRLEHINSWINNCDQKASILLAFVGVVIPLVFSSDIFSGKLLSLVNLIKAYGELAPGTCFSLYNTICCTLFIITIIFAVFTIHHLLHTISSKIDSDAFRQDGMDTYSNFFWGSIAKLPYNSFKQNLTAEECDSINDILSQIYINSLICQRKFDHYRKALHIIKWFLIALCTTMFLLLFVEDYECIKG